MKTFIKGAGVIMLMLAHTSCGTNNLSSRQKRIGTLQQETSTHTREQQQIALARTTAISDSSGKVYQLTIFPTDTVEFSLQNGFKGIASKIELKGTARSITHTNDSLILNVSARRTIEAQSKNEMHTKQLDQSMAVERKGFKLGWLLYVVLTAVVIWGVYKLRKVVSLRWK